MGMVGRLGRVVQQRGLLIFTHLRRTSGSLLEECVLIPMMGQVAGVSLSDPQSLGAVAVNCKEAALVSYQLPIGLSSLRPLPKLDLSSHTRLSCSRSRCSHRVGLARRS